MSKIINPIGIFDSGLGGLSIWREIIKILPFESTLYYADSANCPYGEKSPDEIIELSKVITGYLIGQGAKVVVVACNTATTVAVEELRRVFTVPVIGVEPAVKPAALSSRTGKIGLLATQGTIDSPFYRNTREKFAADVEVIARPGFGLVEAVENGRSEDKTTIELLRRYIEPMLDSGVDRLVLGCTHYPFLIPSIKKIVGDRIEIIDPAPAVARRCAAVLQQSALLSDSSLLPEHRFITSGDKEAMKLFLKTIKPNIKYIVEKA
ncbi:MAG: glutamate racemase [Spirochaetes bacterium]|jgi:glutamate racemase|nr:glutamate racemase [Spirochaetota bacterium]